MPDQRRQPCECDKFLHEDKPCEFEAGGPWQCRGVPGAALCIRCLFYCWADEINTIRKE